MNLQKYELIVKERRQRWLYSSCTWMTVDCQSKLHNGRWVLRNKARKTKKRIDTIHQDLKGTRLTREEVQQLSVNTSQCGTIYLRPRCQVLVSHVGSHCILHQSG